ncbi:histidine kinase [Draconibacterium sp.]|nr:histidine kinase [Draconibacterium sp.]
MEFTKNKIEKVLPHVIGLLLFFILPVFVFDRNNERAIYWIYSYYYQLLFMVVAFYVNYIVIVPRFFFSKRRIYFFAVIFLFAFLLLFISQYLYNVLQFDSLRPEPNIAAEDTRSGSNFGLHPKLIDNFFLLILVLGFSTGMAIIQRLRQNETQQKEIEKARVDSELAFLKNQISPHFFFNSLNNIYALIAVDTDKAQDSVEKLSGLMRYLIYESDIKTVELQKEFEFTQNYIDLMQQRLTSKVKLEINIQQKLPKVEIPPLIFIPFIENAFKHGISYRENSFITVDLRIENDCVVFDCNNSVLQQAKEPGKSGGVGIVNIQKRLGLIYGERAQLTMENDGSAHSVHLVIPLN